jgi:hypothetical protein
VALSLLPLLPDWVRASGGALRCCFPKIHRPSARPSPEVRMGPSPGPAGGPLVPRPQPPAVAFIAEGPTAARLLLLLLLRDRVGSSQGANRTNKTTCTSMVTGVNLPLRPSLRRNQGRGHTSHFRRPSDRRRLLLWAGNLQGSTLWRYKRCLLHTL